MKSKSSPLWKYFNQISKDAIQCKICNKLYSQKGRSTTPLRSHLRAIHTEIYTRIGEELLPRKSVTSDLEFQIKVERPLSPRSTSSADINVSSPISSLPENQVHLSKQKVLEQRCIRWNQVQEASSSDQNDIATSQALVWSNKLQSLDPTQRLYAEKFINDIIFEAELGNLNRYSVKINETFDPLHEQNN